MTQQEHNDRNRGQLQVHHIVSIKDGGSNDESNVDTLCYWCHREYHNYWEHLGIDYESFKQAKPFLDKLTEEYFPTSDMANA